ncbi:MAG: efflux RND transporter permease subunit [Methanocella sp.]
MFKELGQFITRKPWVIIAIWAIILIVMAPLALNLSDRLQYDATSFMPKDTDSQKAQDIYAQQFPQASESSQVQLIAVIQSDNRTATMGFVNGLDAALSKDPSMLNLTGTASVYSAQQMALAAMTPTLYKSMYAAYDGALTQAAAAAAAQANATANATNASGNNVTVSGGLTGGAMPGSGVLPSGSAGTDFIKASIVKGVMQSMNLTGDGSYFTYLLSLDRNLSDTQLMAVASRWAATHDYDNPALLPADVTGSLAKGNVTLYVVTLEADPIKDSGVVSDDVKELRSQISQVKAAGGYDGLNAYVTGSAAMSEDTESASMNDMSNIDMYTILVVLVLLFLYFRSILTPFVPLAAIGVAIVATMGAVTIVSYFLDLYYIVETFMIVLMMGAGIDYCVFMLSRYSEERKNGSDVKSAVTAMVEHAGKSIASSGLTAALGFGALALSGQAMFMSMAIGVSLGIIISMLTGLTLIPAVLTLVGDRMFWPNKLFNSKPRFSLTGMWESVTKFSLKHAKVIVVLTVLIAIPSAYYATQMNTGMDTVSMLPSGVESKVGYTLMADTMGSGTMSRAMVTVTLPVSIYDASGAPSADALGRIDTITADIAKINGVDKVYSITCPSGTAIDCSNLAVLPAAEQATFMANLKSSVGQDNRTTIIYASFTGSPYANEAYKAIDNMRSTLDEYTNGAGQGTEVHVGGASAMMHDVESAMMNGFYIVLPVVVIGILIILFALLRSILLPLRMILSLSVSILVTVAAFILIFQYWQNEVIIFMLPMMLFCALMGTGVDYDIFLVSRIREEKLKGATDREAIKKAVKSTGTIIAICALIMGGAFSTLMLSKMQMMQQMGFVLFFGIMINAIVMLLFVVPSIMCLMGKWNWWMPGQKKNKPEMEEEIKA